MSKMIKNKDDSLFKLEEKAAQYEGEMHRIKQEYIDKDNARQKKFFRTRYEANEQRFNIANKNVRGGGGQSIMQKLDGAAALTSTTTNRISDEDATRGLEMQRRDQFGAGGGGADWTAKAEIEEKDAYIAKLKKVIDDATRRLTSKEMEIARYKQFYDQD